MSTPPSIFISIIAYRDPELLPTLQSLFGQAAQPDRLVAGVVWQGDESDEGEVALLQRIDGFASTLPAGNIRQLRLAHTEARGPCFARHLAQSRLFAQEEFYLQIDSHMRFASGWDDELVRQWRMCNDERAVITTYPPPYQRDNNGTAAAVSTETASVAATSTAASSSDPPTVLCASHFHPSDGMLRIVGRLLQQCPAAPVETALYAAGFAFSSGRAVTDAPYDPHLQNLFFGEESNMAARLYTHGYRFFAPTHNLVWHCWSREYRPSFREVTRGQPTQLRREHIARRRVMRLLNMTPLDEAADAADGSAASSAAAAASSGDAAPAAVDAKTDPSLSSDLMTPLPPYTLGSVRTLQEFYEHTGVDFSTRTVSARGKNGGLDPALFKPADTRQAQLDAVMRLVMQQQQMRVSATTSQ
jgi:[Skp1-protein]-hydroxyproline N-acetylglucosaminyltransferase